MLLPNGADTEQFLYVLKIFGFEQTEQTGSQFTKIVYADYTEVVFSQQNYNLCGYAADKS